MFSKKNHNYFLVMLDSVITLESAYMMVHNMKKGKDECIKAESDVLMLCISTFNIEIVMTIMRIFL
jgi:hypothetical protein